MRALETARPMLRAANTGMSAIIDHTGDVVAASQQFVPAVVKGQVHAMHGETPFMLWGNHGIVLMCALLLLAAYARSQGAARSGGQ